MKTRTALSVLTLITLLFTLFSLPGSPVLAATANVKLHPAAASVQPGQTVNVSVLVENVTSLYGIEVHLTFDPALLEVVDANTATDGIQIAHGDFLSADFVAQNVADNVAGKIDYAISQMHPQTGKSGGGTIAIITFRGKAAGTSAINFTGVLLSDPTGGQIQATSANGSVTVGGVAPTPTTPPPTATTPPPTTTTAPPTTQPGTCTVQGYHTVRAGETLFSIGRAYATRPDRIAACNGIVNANRVYVGTRLAIPVAPWSPIPSGPVAVRQFTPGAPAPTPPPSATCRYYHRVVRGETLTLIGLRYGVSIWTIARANNILNLNLIYAGQVLCIP